MRPVRVALLAALLAGLALTLPGPALAQQDGGSPSAGELWRQYPLGRTASTATTTPAPAAPPSQPAAPPSQPAAAAPAARRSAGEQGGSSSGALFAVVAALGVTAAAAGGTFLVAQRRRTGATAVAAAPDAADEPDTPRAQEPKAMLPPKPDVPWTAEISWEQSERRCRFVAVAATADGDAPEPLGRSPWLGWPPSEKSPVSALAEAVGALEQALVTAGWEPLDRGEAWYAKRFGWMPAAATDLAAAADDLELEFDVGPRFVRGPAWAAGAEERWRCQIRWDGAGGPGRFRAIALPPGQVAGRAVGESAAGSSPFSGEEEVAALVEALLAAGWERAGRGAEWYAERFVWNRDGEPPKRIDGALSEETPSA